MSDPEKKSAFECDRDEIIALISSDVGRAADAFIGLQSKFMEISDAIKFQLLGQAEMEAYDWDRLDNLAIGKFPRERMEAIRKGEE